MVSIDPVIASYNPDIFRQSNPQDIILSIKSTLDESMVWIQKVITEQMEYPTWDGLIVALDDIYEKINILWKPISHLNTVLDIENIQIIHEACLTDVNNFFVKISQDKQLFKALKKLEKKSKDLNLDQVQRNILKKMLKEFDLSGISLSDPKRVTYSEIQTELCILENSFSKNLLGATQEWNKHISNEDDLLGIPDLIKKQMEYKAEEKNLPGWLITLDFPIYNSIMSFSENRILRKKMHYAYHTRATNTNHSSGKFNNSNLLVKVLELREKLANLLGFNSFAELSLVKKMADSPKEVLDFLYELAKKNKKLAQKETTELHNYALKNGVPCLEAWDYSFYSEKLRKDRYSFSQEELREYFPINCVLKGLFKILNTLYGIKITEIDNSFFSKEDLQVFEIQENNAHIGSILLDSFARPGKSGGAWMDSARDYRRLLSGKLQYPIAHIVCNFTPPSINRPALLTHDEVTTLFHEFGHAMQHILTKIEYSAASGINGVPWDAVELPSQLMENWCWRKESLEIISGHYKTNKVLPQRLMEALISSRKFQAGLKGTRQIELALFDFYLHYTKTSELKISKLIKSIREEISTIPHPEYDYTAESFEHIFSGGYAAGYYSYKWSEVLSIDVFSYFDEVGIFNKKVAQSFRENILARGGAEDPIQLLSKFLGRAPSTKNLN